MTGAIWTPGVWCCERRTECRWKGSELLNGLAWGTIPKNGTWLAWHAAECGGRLVQLIEPRPGILPERLGGGEP